MAGPFRVLVIGSGIAGMSCAHQINATQLGRAVQITIADKGRNIGGRLATRTEGDYIWNYGAYQVDFPTQNKVAEHLGASNLDDIADPVIDGYNKFHEIMTTYSQAIKKTPNNFQLRHPARDLVRHVLDCDSIDGVNLFQGVRVTSTCADTLHQALHTLQVEA